MKIIESVVRNEQKIFIYIKQIDDNIVTFEKIIDRLSKKIYDLS